MRICGISEGVLIEGSLSRVIDHSTSPFVILTAFRADFTLKQNRKRNHRLEGEFRSIGAGGIKLIGHWQEAPDGIWMGHNLNEIDPNQLVDTTEESYFVPMPSGLDFPRFKEWVCDVINKYNQDAAVLSDGNSINLIDKSGDLVVIGSKISIDKVQQAYSSLRHKNFVFEGTMGPSSNAHRQLLKSRGIHWL